ncbi:MAG: hypothetical protein ACRDT8_08860 [Micromonosporaceae bacterium]
MCDVPWEGCWQLGCCSAPEPGWGLVTYRYDHDWVVVEFQIDDHVSTVHGYLDSGRATVEVEEDQ